MAPWERSQLLFEPDEKFEVFIKDLFNENYQ